MRTSWLASFAIVIGASGCAVDGPPYGLEITQQNAAIGANLHVGIVQADGGSIIANEWTPIEHSTLDVTYWILEQGVAYQIYVFEDLDGNGNCDGHDHAWRRLVPPAKASVRLDLGTVAQEPMACTWFTSP